MIKKTIFILFFILTMKLSFEQGCEKRFFNASLDTTYLKVVSQTINNELAYCTIPNIEWEDDYNCPRTLIFFYNIKLTCQGKIISAVIENSKFKYTNAKKETITEKADIEEFKIIENCIKNKLLNIKTLDPLLIDKIPQNTEINFVYGLEI